ncbi:MAG: alpha-D-glucose phosphate-specific phosphoglucomutase, partial [Trueperella pyogenes]|nr:alpha-D-glucose phosphate-specific phosphoglucomutase [Trueperella pyogenes]
PHGGPADSDATSWSAKRANEILEKGWRSVDRVLGSDLQDHPSIHRFDYLAYYVDQLDQVIDIDAIRAAGVRIGADPLGGASVDYWGAIAERYGLELTVVNPKVDPAWSFMTLDWDGKIRMDCSSPYAMASLRDAMTPDENGNTPYDIATGNDADSDRHGIVTPDGLMNPNHYLAVAIEYLFTHRPNWPAEAAVGKTLVSSALIDRVADSIGRKLVEVPVGFKYFVPGLVSAELGFGGEESAGASFLRKDGTVWSTDKDGIILALLASEILAVTGKTPSQLHEEQVERFGASAYARIDAPANREEKAKLAALSPEDVSASELAGDPITAKLVRAPGNDATIGGLKVTTDVAWFAARPSGTEDVYKIYAESFRGAEHLAQVQEAAKQLVSEALKG